MKTIYELCSILSIDYNKVLHEVHPCFADSENVQPMSISSETLARLAGTINSLKQEKTHRLQKVNASFPSMLMMDDLTYFISFSSWVKCLCNVIC